MACPNAEWLQLYIDGELEVEKVGYLESHLDQCPTCCSILESLQEEEENLRSSFAPVVVPNHLTETIQQAVAEQLAEVFWWRLSVAILSTLLLTGMAAVFSTSLGWLAPSYWELPRLFSWLADVYNSQESWPQVGEVVLVGMLMFWIVHRYGDKNSMEEKELTLQ